MQETRNNCFGSKNVARPFFRRKQLNTSAEMQQQRTCCISALVLNCFRLTKGRATFFDPKQLLRVSCILWCYYPKCYSINLIGKLTSSCQGPTYRNGGPGHNHYLGTLSHPTVHEDRKEEGLASYIYTLYW